MKCNMDCFHCTRPVEKCHGGDSKKTAVTWKRSAKTTIGKGDSRLAIPGRSYAHPSRIGIPDDPTTSFE